MGETVVKAKNTFGEGLIMDFAPDNTLNTILTNALNATLITYNGNELSLLNDMGNGRVETAFLPEGYVPVGSCEFGGIIYIVSYNPLDNKSQIGCFPSPERNITNDELDNFASLSGSELIDNDGNIKQYSIKKIISSAEVNPGDKFIINSPGIDAWSTQISNFNNLKYKEGINWPKLVKINLVAIEDSGKINYLDSELQWHNNLFWIDSTLPTNPSGEIDIDHYRESISANYSVFQSKVSGKLALLVELEEIDTFSCAVKVLKSGEPTEADGTMYQTFDVYTTTSWEASSTEINPSGFIISNIKSSEDVTILDDTTEDFLYNALAGYTLDSEEEEEEEEKLILHYVPYNLLHTLGDADDSTLEDFIINSYKTLSTPYKKDNLKELALVNNKISFASNGYLSYKLEDETTIGIPDDVINNYNNKQVMKYIGTVKVPDTEFAYSGKLDFTVTPCMPYGKLENLSIHNTINFSDYGNNNANLYVWKYKLVDSQIELTWGLAALMDENTQITNVIFKFRDYLGLCATKEFKNLESYNGVFTTYLPLNNSYGYSKYDENNKRILHIIPKPADVTPTIENCLLYTIAKKGLLDSENIFKYKPYSETIVDPDYKIGLIDSGMIYSNYLYLVEIRIKRESTTTENLSDIIQYRWLWTNGMYNAYYTSNGSLNDTFLDYNKLPLKMQFDINAGFDGRNLKEFYNPEYNEIEEEIDIANSYKTLGSNTHYLGLTRNANKELIEDSDSFITLLAGLMLKNDHGCLLNKQYLSNIPIKVAIADHSIEIPSEYEYEITEGEAKPIEALLPIINNEFPELSSISKFTSETNESYTAFKDSYSVKFNDSYTLSSEPINFIYYKSDNNPYTINTKYVATNAADLSNDTGGGIKLHLYGIKYNKILAESTSKKEAPIFESLIANPSNLTEYNLAIGANGIDCAKYLCMGYGFLQDVIPDTESLMYGIYNSQTQTISVKYFEGLPARSHYLNTSKYSNKWKDVSLNSIAAATGMRNTLFVPIVLSLAASNTDNGVLIYFNKDNSITRIYHGYNILNNYNSLYSSPNFTDKLTFTDIKNIAIPYLSYNGWACLYPVWVPTILGISVNNSLYASLNFFRLSLTIPDKTNYAKLANFVEFANNSNLTIKNYGLLIGSLLGQLYYQTDRTLSYYTYHRVTSLKPFDEIFRTSILITIENWKGSNIATATGCNNFLLVLLPNQLSIEDYYKVFKLNNTAVSFNNVDLTNIKPEFTEETKTVELTYKDPYNIDDINDKYSAEVTGHAQNFIDNDELIEISGDIEANTLYTLLGDELVKVNQNASFYLLDNFIKTTINLTDRPSTSLEDSSSEESLSEESLSESSSSENGEITVTRNIQDIINSMKNKHNNPFRQTITRVTAQKTDLDLLLGPSILENIIYSNGFLKFNLLDGMGSSQPITWEYDERGTQTHLDIEGFSTINIFPYTQIG